jgi:hypothetical protein
MGLGPPGIELYRQVKLQAALTEVVELGSQDFWCPQKNLVTALVKAFGKTVENPALLNTSSAKQKPARLLTKDSILAKEYGTQITGLNNWIDAYKGQELAATKHQLNQTRYGLPPTLSELNKKLESGTTALSGISSRHLASELGRRIRQRIGMLIGRSSPTS